MLISWTLLKKDLKLYVESMFNMKLYCTVKVVCDIAHNPVQHDCIALSLSLAQTHRHTHTHTHIYMDCSLRRSLIKKINYKLSKIKYKDQLIEILNKTVSSHVFLKFLNKLSNYEIYTLTWGGMLWFFFLIFYTGIYN
jgi:hypothetical protein